MHSNTGLKYTLEEMTILADMVSDQWASGGTEELSDENLVQSTGWTVEEFRRLCDFRWNGPVWAR